VKFRTSNIQSIFHFFQNTTHLFVVMGAVSLFNSGCILSSKYKDPQGVWTVSSADTGSQSVCSLNSTTTKIKLATNAAHNTLINNNKVVTPSVVLVPHDNAAKSYATSVSVDAGASSITVTPTQTLGGGNYDVVITNASGVKQTLSNAVNVIEPPTITGVDNSAICINHLTTSFVIHGSNLQKSKVALIGSSANIVNATYAADGTSITVPVPINIGLGKYAVSADNGNGCASVSDKFSVNVVEAPAIKDYDFGPKLHGDPTTVPNNATITLRVIGQNLPSGAQVTVDGNASTLYTATATSGVNDNSSIDVTIPSNTLSSKAHGKIAVQVGACAAALSSDKTFNVAPLTATIYRTSPNAILSNTSGAFLDVFGDARANGVSLPTVPDLFVDTNPDPIAQSWVQLNTFVRLDSKNKGYRYQTPDGLSVITTGNYDLAMGSQGNEAFAQGKLGVLVTGQIPDIVYQEQLGNTPTSATNIYGCNLLGASFQLLDDSYQVVSGVQLSPSANGDEKWGNRFWCNSTKSADQAIQLMAVNAARLQASLPAGVYHLRASVPTNQPSVPVAYHDGLYPFVIYAAGAGPSNFAPLTSDTNKLQLTTARRNPSVVVAADNTGRRYLYVVGGANDTTINPAAFVSSAAAETTYEYSALDEDNNLVGFEVNAGTGDTTWDLKLQCPPKTPACNFTNPCFCKEAYGAAVVADGTNIYYFGGTEDGTKDGTSSLVRQATVSNPLSQAQPLGQLSGFTLVGNMQDNQLTPQPLPLFGQRGVLIHQGNMRQVFLVGGLSSSKDHNSNMLTFNSSYPVLTAVVTESGVTSANTLNTSSWKDLLVGQAFQGLDYDYSSQTLYSALGMFDHEAQTLQTFTFDANLQLSKVAVTSIQGLPNHDPMIPTMLFDEVGFGFLLLNSKIWLLGGVDRTSAVDQTDWDTSRPRKQIFTLDPSSATATSSATSMYRRRGLAGYIHLPPYELIISGAVCSADDPTPVPNPTPDASDCAKTGKRVLDPGIEQAVIKNLNDFIF